MQKKTAKIISISTSFLMLFGTLLYAAIKNYPAYFKDANMYVYILFLGFIFAGAWVFTGKRYKKITWTMPIVLGVIYYHAVFVDLMISTPHGIITCHAEETNVTLNFLLHTIGVVSIPLFFLFLNAAVFGLLIFLEYITRKEPYWRGVIHVLIAISLSSLIWAHVGAAIHNFRIC